MLKNTLDTSFSREVYLSETDADHDLKFDYIRYSSTGTASHTLRYTDNNNRLSLEIAPNGLLLRQADGGVQTTLGTISTTVVEDTWYQVRVIMNGGSVKIYWGAVGGTFNEIFSATTTELTTSRAAWFRAPANSEHGWDDIQLIAGTRSTTETFTYNDANEQLTHAKNGVTTTMTYDDWGRLEERDDGTHTATYGYRYGSKLYSVASDFPGEGNVTYETGGDQKRRSRVAGVEETWYNYTVGFDVVSTEDDADGSSGALKITYAVFAPDAQISVILSDLVGSTPGTGAARYYLDDDFDARNAWDGLKTKLSSYEPTPLGGDFSRIGITPTDLASAHTGKSWGGASAKSKTLRHGRREDREPRPDPGDLENFEWHGSFPFQHCVNSCVLARRTGRLISRIVMDIGKEGLDVLFGGAGGHRGYANSACQPSDWSDNKTGRDCAKGNQDCRSCCKSKGVTPDTPDGPGTERPYGRFAPAGRWGNPDHKPFSGDRCCD